MITHEIRLNKTRLEQIERQTPGATERTLDAWALHGEALIKMSFGTSPSRPGEPPGVDTGTLRASIHVEKQGRFTRAIVAGTDYAPHLEFGTVKMAARPFMAPGADALYRDIGRFWRDFLL